MIHCVTCNKEYKQLGREVSCSLKCKILSKIYKDGNGCWIWKGCKAGPYGKLTFHMKHLSAHKSSYGEFVGEVPVGKWVCHTCDVPACINPDHLFLGSPSDNRRDALKKKRIAVGEDNHFTKFTDIQVQEMRLLKSEGFTLDRISRIFNASVAHIWKIVKYKYRKE